MINMMNKIKLILEKIAKIYSPSGEECELANFLVDYLSKLGYNPKKDEVGNVILNPRSPFLIATHMDTIKKVAEIRINDVSAYGTGVCDAKGSIAAMLYALEQIDELKYGIAFLVDEEEGGTGSKYLLRNLKPDYVIVMEPTSLKIANKHYGSFELLIRIYDDSVHGAYFKEVITPVDMLLEMIQKLKTLNLDFFIQEIKCGSDIYATPSDCIVRLDFPVKPEEEVKNLKKLVIYTIKSCVRKVDIKILEECNGFIENNIPKHLVNAIKSVGLSPEFTEMLSWTDGINFKNAGCKVVIWGPGDLKLCHTKREKISIKEILIAARILQKLNDFL